MWKEKIKSFFAAVFAIVVLVMVIRSNAYAKIGRICEYLGQAKFGQDSFTIDSVENEYSSSLWCREALININGYMAKKLHMRELYSDMGMYIADDYIISASEQTSTDYEYDQIIRFRDFCETNGINLLYVNEPTKYIDDDIFIKNFGVESFSNRNADRFLERIRKAGINTLDLRDNIRNDGIDVKDLFYRTDHHWTVPAGLWATRIMAQALNDHCNYDIDVTIYDDDRYDFVEWKACWLGEQGRKLAKTYVGLDDYTEVKPVFSTSFTFKNGDGSTFDGGFDNFINESIYNTENDVYDNPSWHYSYARIDCINNNVDKGKVLILGDSYDHVTQPFLSLGVHECDSLILRDYDDSFNLRDFILQNRYDTVIVAYAQFMIGAHDNETSANYRMFRFE